MYKVMIVDDEEYIRQGLISKIDWQGKGLELAAEAEDGQTALEILSRQQVDLVITDICLPVKDGFELIRDVSRMGKPVKFIVISGYDKFEYARTAMKYRVTEYLLKPIKEADLNDSLNKIVGELEEMQALERQLRDIAVLHNHQQQKERDLLLGKLVGGKAEMREIRQIRERLNIKGAGQVLVSVMKVSSDAQERLSDELLYFGLQNMFQEISANRGTTFLFRNLPSGGEYVFLSLCGGPSDKTNLYPLFYSFIQAVWQYLRLRITIGMAGESRRLEQAPCAYKEALFAVQERILRGAGKVIDYADLPRQQTGPIPDAGKMLLFCMEERRKAEAKEHLRSWFARIEAERHRFNHLSLQEGILQIYMTLKKYVSDRASDAEKGVRLHEDLTRRLAHWERLEEVVAWFEDWIDHIFNLPIQSGDISGKDIVQLVKSYIDRHFDEDIGLQFIAETYHIHPIYFSRIFKTYVGESFNSYLTRKRMEKARDLLRDPTLKLHEISEIVGYEDPKYFSKVYKKHFGSCPSMHSAN